MPGLLRRAGNILAGRVRSLLDPEPPSTAAWQEPAGGGSRAVAEPPAIDPARARAFAVLELPVGADATDLRRSYRRLCRRYHPDRFDAEPGKRAAATELLAEINRAYDLLVRGRA